MLNCFLYYELKDEKIILDSLKKQLRAHFGDAFIYESAENADEAFEILDELEEKKIFVLLIVSDWLMPGIKGDELLIKVHEKFPNTIKILLTGHADTAAIERAKKYADLQICLPKPWKEEDLIEAIRAGFRKINQIV